MFCYYSNLNIDEIPYERLFIKLRDPKNKEYISKLSGKFRELMENDESVDKFEIWNMF